MNIYLYCETWHSNDALLSNYFKVNVSPGEAITYLKDCLRCAYWFVLWNMTHKRFAVAKLFQMQTTYALEKSGKSMEVSLLQSQAYNTTVIRIDSNVYYQNRTIL